ncbi:endonuclease/exonuclease/phosphatase (EEP) superfamily protein YafD [Rhodopirellula rubra]|uniref:Endonuclease/exonuclease/phosphatase (EEP) superfamily protein YafD n=1 Tax=Aporhodopirellula rubra TaxID=980271 RepID=A0A7W5E3L0_9BACT|nr:endonuclease/exonuclease/phosphatase family protein [Aporhodopirellula rubra]MBB3209217.1 endonuclease/exonuclease/phosphatase (EEP) superfamily protein YafD [Aporhodopirellula rubra]
MFPFSIFTVTLLVVIAAGSLSTISNHPHWLIRAWDFPHVQLAVITVVAAGAYFLAARFHDSSTILNWTVGLLTVLILGWLAYGITPYTPLVSPQTKLAETFDDDRRLCVVISNVELENTQHDLWMKTIADADPDLAIVLEVDDRWMNAIEPFRKRYSHQIAFPQDNWYGMLLLSKFPIVQSEIRFRVTDDVPSIDAEVEMPSGERIRVLAVHPRPPEPIRDNDSAARDAELILYGRDLEAEHRPALIGGDLNDVAWSSTSRLFLRLSGMLDPRRGRGFFNSFNAKHWWMRFPLDHVFHSRHFTLRRIERLGWVGSDHFPMLLDLQCEPARKTEQEPLERRETDKEEAAELTSRV